MSPTPTTPSSIAWPISTRDTETDDLISIVGVGNEDAAAALDLTKGSLAHLSFDSLLSRTINFTFESSSSPSPNSPSPQTPSWFNSTPKPPKRTKRYSEDDSGFEYSNCCESIGSESGLGLEALNLSDNNNNKIPRHAGKSSSPVPVPLPVSPESQGQDDDNDSWKAFTGTPITPTGPGPQFIKSPIIRDGSEVLLYPGQVLLSPPSSYRRMFPRRKRKLLDEFDADEEAGAPPGSKSSSYPSLPPTWPWKVHGDGLNPLAFEMPDPYDDKIQAQNDPTVYEYFATGENLEGLVAGNNEFRLNGKSIRIISGAVHYFRIHPDLWRDRLKKLRAIGANTVETYVPWNLHEPRKGEFDFGNGNNDMSAFLDVRRFVQMAKEEDLLVLFRPGPYICSEWDFGGLPSWLQSDPNMKVRQNYQPYLDHVKLYFDQLLPLVTDLQFTRGGSIIAAQIENEYGSFSPRSKEYLQFIRDTFLSNGLDCLHFTSDNNFGGSGQEGTLDGVLQTANFQTNSDGILSQLKSIQPDMPVMSMEYWSGWFDHWFQETHSTSDAQVFRDVLETIFNKYNGSVNFYMFHGGTNFGFMAGGNTAGLPHYIAADVTSYDYDAPLSEAGDYTLKYEYARALIEMYSSPKLHRPDMPAESTKMAYPVVQVQKYLSYSDIIDQIPSSAKFNMETAVSMENLPMNNDSGMSFGYIIYRKTTNVNNGDIFKGSWPRDFALLLLDGELVPTGFEQPEPWYWINSIQEFPLNVEESGTHTVDLMVESLARVNFGGEGDFVQQKGIAPVHQSSIELNNEEIKDIEIIAAEFKSEWVKGLTGWRDITDPSELRGPVLIQSTFEIDEPADTFLDMTPWHKGIVFINGFNLGRYFRPGPQKTLYVPAPLLQSGTNTITIFEQLEPASEIVFTDTPDLGT